MIKTQLYLVLWIKSPLLAHIAGNCRGGSSIRHWIQELNQYVKAVPLSLASDLLPYWLLSAAWLSPAGRAEV